MGSKNIRILCLHCRLSPHILQLPSCTTRQIAGWFPDDDWHDDFQQLTALLQPEGGADAATDDGRIWFGWSVLSIARRSPRQSKREQTGMSTSSQMLFVHCYSVLSSSSWTLEFEDRWWACEPTEWRSVGLSVTLSVVPTSQRETCARKTEWGDGGGDRTSSFMARTLWIILTGLSVGSRQDS